jgi:hypothetical protein
MRRLLCSMRKGYVIGIKLTEDDSAVHIVLWRGGEFTDLSTLSGYYCRILIVHN